MPRSFQVQSPTSHHAHAETGAGHRFANVRQYLLILNCYYVNLEPWSETLRLRNRDAQSALPESFRLCLCTAFTLNADLF